MLFSSHSHGAEDPSRGQALGADELGFLFVSHMRRAAALVVGVSPVPAIGPGALDFPLDGDTLEGGGVELGEHMECAHPELLGSAVLGVVILATAAAALSFISQLRALSLVAVTAEQLAIDETLGQTLAAQREHAAGEIGAIRSGQNEEAGVGHARVLLVRRENLPPITSKN